MVLQGPSMALKLAAAPPCVGLLRFGSLVDFVAKIPEGTAILGVTVHAGRMPDLRLVPIALAAAKCSCLRCLGVPVQVLHATATVRRTLLDRKAGAQQPRRALVRDSVPHGQIEDLIVVKMLSGVAAIVRTEKDSLVLAHLVVEMVAPEDLCVVLGLLGGSRRALAGKIRVEDLGFA